MGKKTICDYDFSSLHIGFMEDEEANYQQIMEEKISTNSSWRLWCENKIQSETRGSIYNYNGND